MMKKILLFMSLISLLHVPILFSQEVDIVEFMNYDIEQRMAYYFDHYKSKDSFFYNDRIGVRAGAIASLDGDKAIPYMKHYAEASSLDNYLIKNERDETPFLVISLLFELWSERKICGVDMNFFIDFYENGLIEYVKKYKRIDATVADVKNLLLRLNAFITKTEVPDAFYKNKGAYLKKLYEDQGIQGIKIVPPLDYKP